MKSIFTSIYVVLLLALIGLGVFGWGMNILKLIDANAIDGMVIARAIGIFVAPLGAILGYF